MNTLRMLNTMLILLNSQQAIHALFAKKAEHYWSKPSQKMATLSDLTMRLPFMNPGKDFSNAREEFETDILHTMAVGTYNGDYETSSRRFIQPFAENLHTADLTS